MTPTVRRYPRSIAEAWPDGHCIETARGVRIGLPHVIPTRPTPLQRLVRAVRSMFHR